MFEIKRPTKLRVTSNEISDRILVFIAYGVCYQAYNVNWSTSPEGMVISTRPGKLGVGVFEISLLAT